jgi:hypothetical protein
MGVIKELTPAFRQEILVTGSATAAVLISPVVPVPFCPKVLHSIIQRVIAKHTKVDMIWVAGRSPTLVSQNLKATTLTYLAITEVQHASVKT